MKRLDRALFRAALMVALLVTVVCANADEAPAGAPVPKDPFAAFAVAPAGDASPDTHTFVGTITGAPDSARIGVVCDGKNFLAYACSEDAGFNGDHAAWFKGAAAGKSLAASNGARTLKATVSDDAVTGEITSGGKTMTFTAKRCDDHAVAGLYRAEDDGVYGWVIDEDGNVAGGLQRPGTKGTAVVPNNGVLGGVKGPVNKNGLQAAGQRVQNPAQPPTGKKVKGFSQARRDEFLARVQAKTPQNGNPLLPALIHMVKRFNSGAKAETKVEEAAFAQLRKAPRQALVDYQKNWEKIPLPVRQRLAGPELAKTDAKTPLTVERMRDLVKKAGIPTGGPPVPQAGSAPSVTQVRVRELRALDTTGEVKDEIFAVYVVGTGNQLFTKTTAVLDKIGNGTTRKFADADQIVFPPAEQPTLTSFEDVLITATLFEQDNNIALVKTLVKVLVDSIIVTVAIVTAPAGAGAAGFVVPANLLIDQIAAGLPDAQTLGTDTFRATTDGKLKKIENNTSVSELRFKQTTKQGPGPFDFRLTDLSVKN